MRDFVIPRFEGEPMFRPPSVVGEGEVPFPLINAFAQQRAGANERQGDLNRSIAAKGFLYPVDVTILSASELTEYLNFTNRIWQAQHSFEDFVPYEDDRFITLIAGHSRLKGFAENVRRVGGTLANALVRCQFHTVNGVDDYIGIQVAENIHSAPPQSRAARAYAESFLWAKERDPQLSQAAFIREKGIGRHALQQALLYANLSPEIREQTDEGNLPFSVAVEIARAQPVLEEDARVRVTAEFGKEYELFEEEVERIVFWETQRFVSLFNGRLKRHVTNTKQHIRGRVDAIRERQKTAEDLAMSLFDAREFDERKDQLIAAVENLLRDFVTERELKARGLHEALNELTSLGVSLDRYAVLQDAAQLVYTERTQQALL